MRKKKPVPQTPAPATAAKSAAGTTAAASVEKPMAETTAARNAATPAAAPDRRRFFKWLWTCLGLAAAAQFGWIALSFLVSRKDRHAAVAAARIVAAGPIDQFAPATVTPIPSGQFFLARLEDGGFLALSRTCTHLGCSLHWDGEKNRFQCPCHGSSFGLTGEVLSAPATRPLDYYPVRIENGIVKVDAALPRRRDRFEPAQATRI
jgi:Rieske Fe-S protein